MKVKKSGLTRVIFISWLTTIISLSIVFVIISIYYKYNDFEGTTSSLNKAHVDSYKRSLKSNVDNAIKILDYIVSKENPEPIDPNSKTDESREKVLAEFATLDPFSLNRGSTYLINREKKIVFCHDDPRRIGKSVVFLDKAGRDVSDMVVRLATGPLGKDFEYFRKMGKQQAMEGVLCFAKENDKLGLIVCSEIPLSALNAAIALNLSRFKINLSLETKFVAAIFLLIILITIFYIYRLSASIKSELLSIITFIKNAPDVEVIESFKPDKFQFREFETIGKCCLIMVKQFNKFFKKLGDETIESELASQSKSSLFAGLSHDMLVELNTVMGMSRILLDSNPTPEAEKNINQIYHSSLKISSMLNDLETAELFDASSAAERRDVFSIKQLFGEAVRFIEKDANDKGIEFHFDIGDSMARNCVGNPVRIRQLFINLLANSISFCDKGVVKLKLDGSETDDKFVLAVTAENTGEGFLGTELKEILSFPNARSQFSMVSLRIAVCKLISKKLEGDFNVSSVKEKGTVYTLELPLEVTDQEVETPIDEATPELVDEKDQRKGKILIVEDDPANRAILDSFLRHSGYETTMAVNGEEGVQMFEDNNYDLVLMDCQMPVLNGFDAARRIRETEKGREIWIIAVSGCTTPNDKADCFKAGMSAFLAKPVDYPKLLSIIKKQIG